LEKEPHPNSMYSKRVIPFLACPQYYMYVLLYHHEQLFLSLEWIESNCKDHPSWKELHFP
jgi:hypothetical protein